ncbi:TPA: hypothetical protein N3A45_003661 [Salmonella enterica subsp. salamae serovar [1],40:z35:e,n,x,z15]|nr:hypothetical protein [Salmonella enterica subsp. salamae serovar [1],40:z35:e,n,x,z15]
MIEVNHGIIGGPALLPGLISGDTSPALGMQPVPEFILDKLLPENSTGLGSTSVQGTLLLTQPKPRRILDVVNMYLKNPLTESELALILGNREQFKFTAGVGDRRPEFKGRFRLVENWQGEDVSGYLLSPDPYNNPQYRFLLTFSGEDGSLVLTDSHANQPDKYGSLRYFTIRMK